MTILSKKFHLKSLLKKETFFANIALQISSKISFEKAFSDAQIRGINDVSMVYLLWWKDTKIDISESRLNIATVNPKKKVYTLTSMHFIGLLIMDGWENATKHAYKHWTSNIINIPLLNAYAKIANMEISDARRETQANSISP